MNRERLLNDAKQTARELAASGYSAPVPRTDIPAPGENMLASLKLGVHMMRQGEFISDHDVKGGQLGGVRPVRRPGHAGHAGQRAVPAGPGAGGFLSLCGEKKTQERIAFTLKTGKPLRN